MKFDETQVRRTMSGIVRAEIANIDLWLKRGARLSDIYNQFLAQGLVGSFHGFKKAVQRARWQVDTKAGALQSLSAPSASGASPGVQASADLGPEKASGSPSSQVLIGAHKPTSASDEKVDVQQFFRRKSIFERKGK